MKRRIPLLSFLQAITTKWLVCKVLRPVCPLKSSYIGQFADSFWSEEDLSRALDFSGSPEGTEMAYEYYDLHESDYVSDYAAVSPEEDFAETFAHFVLLGKPAGKNMGEEKVRYLYNYPDLVKLRQIIRQNR